VDGSAPVPLHVEAEWGTPPLAYSWSSTLQGPLGSGADLEVGLANGTHALLVEVIDANGATAEAAVQVQVENSEVPLPDSEERGDAPDPSEFQGTVPGSRGRIVVQNRPRLEPTGADDGSAYVRSAPAIYVWTPVAPLLQPTVAWHFEEFRYVIQLTIRDQTFRLASAKCSDFPYESDPDRACLRPALNGPIGEGDDAHYFAEIASRTTPSFTGGNITSQMVVDHLPGQLTLDWNYELRGDVYAGPDASVLGPFNVATARPLGGVAQGVIPKMTWSYTPPEDGIPCDEIVRWCELNRAYDNGYGVAGCNIPEEWMDPDDLENHICCDDETYPVDNFTLVATAALVPQRGMATAFTSLIRDIPLPLGLFDLAAHEGGLDCSEKPWWTPPGANFCRLSPIGVETSARVAVPTGGGDSWESFHGKGTVGRKWVHFPGGNSPIDVFDRQGTVHYHESWFQGASYHSNQSVWWTVTDGDEGDSPNYAAVSSFADGATLYNAATNTLSARTWLWVTAAGSLSSCGGPCDAFVAPMFFSW
jgi:hypothetical protein